MGVVVAFALLAAMAVLGPQAADAQLQNLDSGLLHRFVEITMNGGGVVSGQIVGVYNERVFMWTPADRDTIAVVRIGDPSADLDSFTSATDGVNSIFTLNTDQFSDIKIVQRPVGQVSYTEYMRQQRVTIHEMPLETEAWISTAFLSYHLWEDGRSNYAWDFGVVEESFGTYLSYRYPGTQNRDFFVFGKRIYLPFGGRVTLVDRDFPDNPPNIDGAVEIEDNEDGTTVDLEEQPHNAVEITPGGPFILRLLHLQDGTIPQNIEVGQTYPAGTYVGDVGNSGTSYVPHLHLALDFIDQNGRLWSVPIEWERYQYRHLLPYSTGFEYGPYHNKEYGQPEFNNYVRMQN